MTVQLLVSVRNGAEARIAVAAGADIIDVKEPDQGSLGCAGSVVINEVLREVNGARPVSAALGECCQWRSEASPAPHEPFAIPEDLSFAKLGMSRTLNPAMSVTTFSDTAEMTAPRMDPPQAGQGSRPAESASPWTKSWVSVRDSFENATSCDWVAVAYADHTAADAPAPMEILAAAIPSGCSTLLVDTWGKAEKSVFDITSVAELKALCQNAHEAGLQFALAGQLRLAHVSQIREVAPDIVGVRGAVCDGLSRTAGLSAARIIELKTTLDG